MKLPPICGYYAGIGSRDTPEEVCRLMTLIARVLEKSGWVLRSGRAEKADQAFEAGVTREDRKEIYLPWAGFGEGLARDSMVATTLAKYPEALEIAAQYHWAARSEDPKIRKKWDDVKKLMGRNVFQIFGKELKIPSRFVICWAPKPILKDGRIVDCKGGTGMALRVAEGEREKRNQPTTVYHLGIPEHLERIFNFIKKDWDKEAGQEGQSERVIREMEIMSTAKEILINLHAPKKRTSPAITRRSP